MYEHVPSESLLEIDRGFCTHSTRWFDRRHSWAIDFLKSHYKELVQVVLLPFFPPNFLERIGLFRPLEWFQMRAKIHKFFDLGSGYSSSAWGLLTKGIKLYTLYISRWMSKNIDCATLERLWAPLWQHGGCDGGGKCRVMTTLKMVEW